MRVHFLGVRGSTPAPGAHYLSYGGHTSSVALSRGDEAPRLILDAGTGIRHATELLGGAPFVGDVLLTHLHWDHVHGLPFFAGANRADAHTIVRLPVQRAGDSALETLARGFSPPHFPVRPDQLTGWWTFESLEPGNLELGDFRVMVREIPHKGGRTYGFRIEDASSSVAYLPDHRPNLDGPGPEGIGEYHEAALDLASGVDLLIHDAQLLAEEVAAESGYGHAAAEYAVALAHRAGCARVMLFHHKPDRTDEQLDALAQRFIGDHRVALAREGEVVEL